MAESPRAILDLLRKVVATRTRSIATISGSLSFVVGLIALLIFLGVAPQTIDWGSGESKPVETFPQTPAAAEGPGGPDGEGDTGLQGDPERNGSGDTEPPLGGTAYLSDLKGGGGVLKDAGGEVPTIGGQTFPKSIVMQFGGINPSSRIWADYSLDGRFRWLEADIGLHNNSLDENCGTLDSLTVEGDGLLLYQHPQLSEVLGRDKPPLHIRVDITGVQQLRLLVYCEAGNEARFAYFVWGDARVTDEDGSTTQPSPFPSACGLTYTVQPGDTPALIAAKCGIDVEELLKANGITDATDIRVGGVMTIPQ
jgi:hypothetical protein